MSHPEELNASPDTPENGTSPLGAEKISAETNAALHALNEEDGTKKAPTNTDAGDDSPPSPEKIAEIKDAIAEALGDDLATDDNAELAAKEDESAQLKEQLMRTMADMENLRKRTERELGDARKYAVTGFARDMVNVVENLQLALQNIPAEDRKANEKIDNLAQGVEMTYNELIRIFESNGIVRIDPKGEKFNHNHHQAVAQVEDADATPGHVIQVLQAGYIIHDRLLRPAMVTVAKGGEKAASVSTEA